MCPRKKNKIHMFGHNSLYTVLIHSIVVLACKKKDPAAKMSILSQTRTITFIVFMIKFSNQFLTASRPDYLKKKIWLKHGSKAVTDMRLYAPNPNIMGCIKMSFFLLKTWTIQQGPTCQNPNNTGSYDLMCRPQLIYRVMNSC